MKDVKPEPQLPPRRYLSREEAAACLGVSIETFIGLGIPYCDFGPRSRRWDLVDIIAYADDNKSCDSARTPATDKRSGRQCQQTVPCRRRYAVILASLDHLQQPPDTIATDTGDDPELGKMSAEGIDQRRALADEQLKGPMQHQDRLLLG